VDLPAGSFEFTRSFASPPSSIVIMQGADNVAALGGNGTNVNASIVQSGNNNFASSIAASGGSSIVVRNVR
jgi:hypothetical protein